MLTEIHKLPQNPVTSWWELGIPVKPKTQQQRQQITANIFMFLL